MERKPEPPRYQAREPLPSAEKRLTWRSDKLAPRVEVRYQIPGVGHPDRPIFDVLATALTPYLQSALAEAGIGASVNVNTRVVHTERFGVPASINFELIVSDPGQLEAAEATLLAALARVSEEPLTAADVAHASKRLRTDWYRLQADPNALAFQIGHFHVMDNWRTLQAYLDARDAATPADVSRLADTYFIPRNRSVGVVTPEGA
jgi:zinc protease